MGIVWKANNSWLKQQEEANKKKAAKDAEPKWECGYVIKEGQWRVISDKDEFDKFESKSLTPKEEENES